MKTSLETEKIEESKSSQLCTSDPLTLEEEPSVSSKSCKKKGRPFDSLTNI